MIDPSGVLLCRTYHNTWVDFCNLLNEWMIAGRSQNLGKNQKEFDMIRIRES